MLQQPVYGQVINELCPEFGFPLIMAIIVTSGVHGNGVSNRIEHVRPRLSGIINLERGVVCRDPGSLISRERRTFTSSRAGSKLIMEKPVDLMFQR